MFNLHKDIKLIKQSSELSRLLVKVGYFFESLELDKALVKLSADNDDVLAGLSLREELMSNDSFMGWPDFKKLFIDYIEKSDGSVEEVRKSLSDYLPQNIDKKLNVLIKIIQNLALYSVGELKSKADKAVMAYINKQIGSEIRDLMRVLDKKNRTDLIEQLRESMMDSQRRAISDVANIDSDLSPDFRGSSEQDVERSDSKRKKHLDFLRDYRNPKSWSGNSAKITELKKWVAMNYNDSLIRGLGNIPYDQSVRAINPQSKWTLEGLSKDKDKLIRGEAKYTMQKMRELKDRNGRSVYELQKEKALKTKNKIEDFSENIDDLDSFHERVIDRISRFLDKPKKEDISEKNIRLKNLFNNLNIYEMYFDGTAPNTQSKISNSLYSMRHLKKYIQKSDDSGRFIVPIITDRQANTIEIARRSGDDIGAIVDGILSGQARNANSAARKEVESICNDIARFVIAEDYLIYLSQRKRSREAVLGRLPQTKENAANIRRVKADINAISLIMQNIKDAIKTGDRQKINNVDLTMNDDTNSWLANPQELVSEHDEMYDERVWSVRKKFKGRKKEDGRGRHQLTKNKDHWGDRPDSKNLWWQEYLGKIMHAKSYRNEYGYNAAAVMVVICARPRYGEMQGDREVIKHINNLTTATGTQHRVGGTVGDMSDKWPQFLINENHKNIPQGLRDDGYRACIKAIASLVGYSGEIPEDIDMMRYSFGVESKKIDVSLEIDKLKREQRADRGVDQGEVAVEYEEKGQEPDEEVAFDASSVIEESPQEDSLPAVSQDAIAGKVSNSNDLRDGEDYVIISGSDGSDYSLVGEFTYYDDNSKMSHPISLINMFIGNQKTHIFLKSMNPIKE